METYIPISYINDFIFCPRSIYFHNLFGKLTQTLYQDRPQVEGRMAHQSIDSNSYSSKKNILQGIEVYTEKYNLFGKIDIFYAETGELVERKNLISTIYDGYIFQIYAQYFALTEMGYLVKSMYLYSLKDNKKHAVLLPADNIEMKNKFEKTIVALNNFNLADDFYPNEKKCAKCIYSTLCDKAVRHANST